MTNTKSENDVITRMLFVCLGSMMSITVVSGVVLTSIRAHAETTQATAAVTVPASCTMTGSGMDSHTATIAPGTYSAASGSTYENGIGATTLTTFCNDAEGFAIYAVGYTNDTYGNNNLVGTNSAQTIPTKVYASIDTTSNWSMRANKVTDSTAYMPSYMNIDNSYDSWHTVPSTLDKVAHFQATTGSSNTDATKGARITTTYATYISGSQAADTYTGQVKYVLVHPASEVPAQPQAATPGCINYFANASNAVGTMGCQSATDGNDIDLLASNFSRTNYGFAGWSDTYDYETNQNAHFYGPQETITVPTGTTANGLSLYAVWVPSAGSLQDSTKVAELCGTGTGSLITAPTNGTANLSSVSALTDQRDNETYAIAKLADGKCWMIENLRLESTNSDNSTGALAQGYGASNTYGNFGGLADAESTNFSNSTTANSLYYSYNSGSSGATIKIGPIDNPGYRFPRYNNRNNQSISSNRPQNPSSNSDINNTTNASMYSYGNYYTWAAAIANTSYYTTNNTIVDTTSICPKGWRLPIGGQNTMAAGKNGDFYVLTKTITGMTPNVANGGYAYYEGTVSGTNVGKLASNLLRSYPNNFLYSGYFVTAYTNDGERGSSGVYWSSTSYGYYDSYHLTLGSSRVSPGTSDSSKYVGRTVRCTVSAGT